MTRIEPLNKRTAHPLVRWTFGASRRDLGREVDPVGVYAYAPRLLLGYGAYEKATAKEHRVEGRLKVLARHQIHDLLLAGDVVLGDEEADGAAGDRHRVHVQLHGLSPG